MITKNLRKIRKKMKLTQQGMADLLELNSASHYNMIELGRRGVSLDLFVKISEVSGIPMDELYSALNPHEVTTFKGESNDAREAGDIRGASNARDAS